MNQDLDRLLTLCEGKLPIDEFTLNETDDFWRIIWDVELLKNVYNLMLNHPSGKVRSKYLTYWQFYKMRYKDFVDEMENSDFNPNKICESYDWGERVNFMLAYDSE